MAIQTISEFLDERDLRYELITCGAIVEGVVLVVPYRNTYVAVALVKDGVYVPNYLDRTIDPLDNFGTLHSIITCTGISHITPQFYGAFGKDKDINIDEFTKKIWNELFKSPKLHGTNCFSFT